MVAWDALEHLEEYNQRRLLLGAICHEIGHAPQIVQRRIARVQRQAGLQMTELSGDIANVAIAIEERKMRAEMVRPLEQQLLVLLNRVSRPLENGLSGLGKDVLVDYVTVTGWLPRELGCLFARRVGQGVLLEPLPVDWKTVFAAFRASRDWST